MINGRKIISVTPGYCSAAMFEASRERAKDKWTQGVVDEFWLLLNKYPLPSVNENERALRAVAECYGYRTFDSGDDLGLHGSLNNFFLHNPQPPGTIMIGFDPDSATDDAGFDKAIAEVMCAEPGLPLVALGIPETQTDKPAIIAGYKVLVHISMMMFNICGFDLDFVAACGGFDQPVKYWGGLEGTFYPMLKKTHKHLGYLMDYREARPVELSSLHDERYSMWKWEQFYGRFPGSFADYLESLCC